MTEDFPKLKKGQVALMRAATQTGIVLDDNFNATTKDNQSVYTLFDNVEAALNYAKSIVVADGEFECVIYGKDKAVIYFISPYNIGSVSK